MWTACRNVSGSEVSGKGIRVKEYNQLIVDTIRSTGGNNEKRFIMVEGLAAGNLNCISIANENSFTLPNDTAEDKLIPTFHYYPMECGKPFSKKVYSRSVKITTQEMFASFDSLYFSKHIPVYMSEGFHDRSIPIMERISCLKDFMARSTPSEYKFEFQIETTGPDAVLQVSYNDLKLVWRELVQQENVTIQGGTLKDGWCIAISESGTVTLSIDEKLALDLECAEAIYINGCNIIIKSMKVVE